MYYNSTIHLMEQFTVYLVTTAKAIDKPTDTIHHQMQNCGFHYNTHNLYEIFSYIEL